MPAEPEREAQEWRDAVLLNRTTDVEPLLDAAIRRLGMARPPDGLSWRQYLRLALMAAATPTDSMRDVSKATIAMASPPPRACPAIRSRRSGRRRTTRPLPPPNRCRLQPRALATASPLFSVSYDEFLAKDTRVPVEKTRTQGRAVRDRFISIIGNLPTLDIGQSVIKHSSWRFGVRRR